uniref:Peptidoglycan-associated lipoprotein n=1 Tax=Candidatus Kentrum sp. DK TaxID=2126562 RepID=A0A450RVF5_9GAMM|nr:MAG: peptidoglycan-associated lipoprotein [Candidatus Kentron sp. DK]VFJ62480.1 MAG: peptidoglycan-associated lipoprotein [Candidatus Kentron sp. DK]
MKKRIAQFVVIGLSSLVLISCGSLSSKDGDSAAVEDRNTGVAYADGIDSESGPMGSPLDDPSSPLSDRVIYFNFDQSDIGPEYREIIEAHARYIARNPDLRVTLTGHCDERGSRDYNLALGERRADAVARLMGLINPLDGQLQTISYGEEQPVALGHSEAAWRQNRRVEILYPNR